MKGAEFFTYTVKPRDDAAFSLWPSFPCLAYICSNKLTERLGHVDYFETHANKIDHGRLSFGFKFAYLVPSCHS